MSTEHEAHTPAAGEHAATEEAAHREQASDTETTNAASLEGGSTSEQGAETPAESEGNSDQPQRESRAKERIQELVRRAKEAETRAERAEKTLQDFQGQSEPVKQAHEYESEDEYQRALIREEFRRAERERQERERKSAAEQAQQARQEIWDARAAEARQRIPDFEQVAYSPNVPYSRPMLETVQESDYGPEIAYHLGKNLHEADRIARLSPLAAAREIGRLETRFSQKAPKKVSTAPPPVKTVSGQGATEEKAPEDMSYDEYRKWRGF